VIGVLAKAVVGVCSQLMKILVMYTAALSGINYSLVINLYSLSPFLTSFAFYLIFQEKLKPFHLAGIALLFLCVIITGHSSSNLM
jgi:drug/metabolite transporter (DMT)-like permease